MTQVIDWPGRMQELAEFVGLDQEGLELIQSTREIVLEHGEELTASVYDNFLDFPKPAASSPTSWARSTRSA